VYAAKVAFADFLVVVSTMGMPNDESFDVLQLWFTSTLLPSCPHLVFIQYFKS